MKNKLWLIIGFFYSVLMANSEEIPLSLPYNQNYYENTATKSPCSVNIVLQGINNSGGYSTAGMLPNNLSFDSYNDYVSFVTSNSSRLFNFIDNQCTNIHLTAYMSYMDLDSDGNISLHSDLEIDKDVNNITDLQNLNPVLKPIIVIPMTNVSSATLQFSNGNTQILKLAGSNGFNFDMSILNSNEEFRVVLIFSDGSTATYSQNGSLIAPPVISMLCIPYPPIFTNGYDSTKNSDWYNWYSLYYSDKTICYPYYGYWNFPYPYYKTYDLYNFWQVGYKPPIYQPINLVVRPSSGVNVLIQSSFDLVNWTNVMIIPWNSSINLALFPVDGYYISGNFFRAIAY